MSDSAIKEPRAPDLPKPAARRVGPVAWLIFRRYHPSGARTPLSWYLKIGYGLVGVLFILFAGLSTLGEGPSISQDEIDILRASVDSPGGLESPPSAFYWAWLPPLSQGRDATATASKRFMDDDMPRDNNFVSLPPAIRTWGTDRKGEDLWIVIGQGALLYLYTGSIALLIALVGGLLWALACEWPRRPRLPLPGTAPRLGRIAASSATGVLNVFDGIPKFFLLLAVYGLGQFTTIKLAIGIGIVILFGATHLLRAQIARYTSSEPYLYALELGESTVRILFVRLLIFRLVPTLLFLIPLALSSYILFDTTMTYLGFAVGDIPSWGKTALDSDMLSPPARNWGFWIAITATVFSVSSLYLLGDGLRERFDVST